jgi:hypothetical protein
MLWSMYAYFDADVLMMKNIQSFNTFNVHAIEKKKAKLFNLFLPRNSKPYQD